MHWLRALIARHHRLAAVLVALTLAMKALVPAGYMVDSQSKVLTIRVCADSIGQDVIRQITVPGSAKDTDNHKAHAEPPCPFTALGHAALGGADPLQLAEALLFILALGLAELAPTRLLRIAHLRPPLRGPPAAV